MISSMTQKFHRSREWSFYFCSLLLFIFLAAPTQAQVGDQLAATSAQESEPNPLPAPPEVRANPETEAPNTEPSVTPMISGKSSPETLLLLFSALLIILMQPGFCLVELGHVRAKNGINVIAKSLLMFSITAVAYLVGFSVAYGPSRGGWIGLGGIGQLFQQGAESQIWLFWLGQMGMAAAAAAIPTGAMGERAKLKGMMLFSAVFAGLIYPALTHWVWGSHGGRFGLGGMPGWLEQRQFRDFGGSTVIHVVGGACALAGTLAVGPRFGRFGHDGSPRLIVGHNLPLTALGTFILWFGWHGFHCLAHGAADAALGRIAVNTMLAPALGVFTALMSRWVIDGKPDAGVALNGAIAGLVAISASCNIVSPLIALVIGAVAGLIVTFGSIILEKIRVDDVVSAIPVHLFCGIWGTLAVALFDPKGIDTFALGFQATGCIAACVAAFTLSFVAFKLVDMLVGLRATQPEQEDGLDFAEHDANAYPDFLTTDQE